MIKKIIFLLKNNIFGFVLGAILFSGIGYVVAAGISSSSISYTNSKNSSVDNIEEALDDLYIKSSSWTPGSSVSSTNTYDVYWSTAQGGTGTVYAANAKPTTTYRTMAQVGSASVMSFIKTTLNSSGAVVKHEACLYVRSKVFCFGPNYWVGTIGTQDETAAQNTFVKLKPDMELALGSVASEYSVLPYRVSCIYDAGRCSANYNGAVNCYDGTHNCLVYTDGRAYCD